MNILFPRKLTSGSHVRVIAPSRSLGIISDETRDIARDNLEALGLKLSFGKHVEEMDEFRSSLITARIEDLHDAFADDSVDGILTVIGGFNSNQLLSHIDWDLIAQHPKILCGFSDITALSNACFAKTGLVTYSGPHFSTFGQKQLDSYTVEYFKKALMSEEEFAIEPSTKWTDDSWWLDQNKRKPLVNDGWWVMREGKAEGTILGANLCTFNLLQGTQYMPKADDIILFIEDDEESSPHTFDRDLQSLIHQREWTHVRGIVIGRFQQASKMTQELLRKILDSKEALKDIPVIANVDYGHTEPKITFPIGGTASMSAQSDGAQLRILSH